MTLERGFLMFCHKCGHELPAEAKFCTRCGTAVNREELREKMPNRDYVPTVQVRTQNNCAVKSAPQVQIESQEKNTVVKKKATGVSVASLVFGILSLLLFPLGLILGLVAVICGGIGLKRSSSGMASAGLAMGIIGMVLGVVVSAIIFFSIYEISVYDVWDTSAPYMFDEEWSIPEDSLGIYI